MTPQQHKRMKELFDAAIELPHEERAAYLDQHCGDDAELRAEVNALLAAHEGPTNPLLRTPARDKQRVPTRGAELIGQQIGHYRIIDIIGRGGMGVVYRAEQDHPKRIVALKVINPGIASPAVLRRFEHESNILGRLQHPGIAHVYEASTFDLGAGGEPQPFFAMEFIEGEPLTTWAEKRNLSTRQRLELMVKVCEAVQHAHQKGIIHRDLKPGNILVTPDGTPKILDFGIARATDADIQTTTLRTDIGQLIGTIPYMSPEQAGGNPDDLDTRSDVYALGVICYELLAGRLPYDLRNRMIHEAVRVIREEDHTPLSSIDRTYRGDVEIIIGKALEKEKDRRYQSAQGLAQDLERYLHDEPIIARPPSTWYQVSKFARRNTALVGGVAATFVVLVAGLIGTTYGLTQTVEARTRAEQREQEAITAREAEAEQRRIAEEREADALAAREAEAEQRLIAEEREWEAEQRAEQLELVASFQESQLAEINTATMGINLRRGILDKRRAFLEGRGMDEAEVAKAMAALEKALTGVNFTNVALEALDENIFERALNVIDEEFKEQPDIRARLLQTVANTLRTLGLLDRAYAPQNEAVDIRRQVFGDLHPHTLDSLNLMGMLLQIQGQLAEAQSYWEEALAGRRRTLGNNHPHTLQSIDNMGFILQLRGRLSDAVPYHQEAVDGSRDILGNEHPQTARSMTNMAYALGHQGKLTEAEPYVREALGILRRTLGDTHPETLTAMNNMGFLLRQQGKQREAESYYRESLEVRRRHFGNEHPDTLVSINNLGMFLLFDHRTTEAELYLREALDGYRRILGDEHPDMLRAMNNIGGLLRDQGRLRDAEPFWRDALNIRRDVLGSEHPQTLVSTHNLGTLLWQLGESHEAEVLLRSALTKRRQAIGDSHPQTLDSMLNLSRLLQDRGEFAEAEGLALECEHGRRLRFGDDHSETLEAMRLLADLYDAWHAAEPDHGYDATAAEWRAKLPAPDPATEPDDKEVATTEGDA